MDLMTKINREYTVAYKARDSVHLGVLRLLKTALKNFQVEHMRPPDEDDILKIIARQCKQRQDSIAQFTVAGRTELAEKEAAEQDILLSYLPPYLNGEELATAIRSAVAETGAEGPRDMGRVMQALMAAHKGMVDGKMASEAVKNALRKLG